MSKSNKDARKSQQKWYFVTNHLNVQMYLAMNTISSTFVSHRKYYKDSLIEYPGWIPLFSQELPEWIINQSQSGVEGDKVALKPILLDINLSNYNGELFVYSEIRNKWIETNISQINNETFINDNTLDTSLVLIPAQLATGYINSITVPTVDVKKQIEDKALDTNNFNTNNYRIISREKIFQRTTKHEKLTSGSVELTRAAHFEIDYTYINAIAGVYAVLSLLANVNDQALNALSSLLKKPLPIPTPSTNSDENDSASHPKHLHEIIDNFCRWVLNPCTEISDSASKVFIDTVKIIINSTNTVRSKEKILELLNAQARDEQSQQFVADLSGKLGLSSKPFDELMETYSTRPLNRVLLMFFYAEDIERFLNLDKSKSKLNEVEVVLAATLLALDTGWLKLPSDFKTYATIEKPISFVMTKLGQIHKGIDTSMSPDDLNSSLESPVVDFDDIDFPMPIRHLLMDKWNKPQQDAAKVLIKEQNWDCIDYEVVFPQGSYEFDTTKTYLKIKSKSEIKVKEIVDQNKFLHLMSQLNYIDAATEKSMRGKL